MLVNFGRFRSSFSACLNALFWIQPDHVGEILSFVAVNFCFLDSEPDRQDDIETICNNHLVQLSSDLR